MRRAIVSAVVAIAIVGCGRVGFDPTDARVPLDAPRSDAGAIDAGPPIDASSVDASPVDAGPPIDATAIDAPLSDSGSPDAGTAAECGDGVVETTEGCDDGALRDGDGCSGSCAEEPGWTCSGEPSFCARSTCGALRLHYRFEESSGAARDSSGCGNDGEPLGGVTRDEPGPRGRAYRFNTAAMGTAHVHVSDSASLSSLPGATIEAWVRHTGGSFEAVLSHGNGMDGDPYILHTYSARDPALTFGHHPACIGMGSEPSAATLPIDAWAHVATSIDATTGEVVIYVNAAEVYRRTTTLVSGGMCDNAEPMIIGAMRSDGTWAWQGWIDEVQVWSGVRTRAEICSDAGGAPSGPSCVFP